MAKNRKKKQPKGAVAMDITEPTVSDLPQDMDTSEPGARSSVSTSFNGKIKGRPMKRSKNARKKKAIAKAIASSEKSVEKVSKNESKTIRTQSAKALYD